MGGIGAHPIHCMWYRGLGDASCVDTRRHNFVPYAAIDAAD